MDSTSSKPITSTATLSAPCLSEASATYLFSSWTSSECSGVVGSYRTPAWTTPPRPSKSLAAASLSSSP